MSGRLSAGSVIESKTYRKSVPRDSKWIDGLSLMIRSKNNFYEVAKFRLTVIK